MQNAKKAFIPLLRAFPWPARRPLPAGDPENPGLLAHPMKNEAPGGQ